MLKRMLLIALSVLLALPAMAEGALLEDHAARLAQEIPLLVGNEAYVRMYAGPFWEGDEALIAGTWQSPAGDAYLSVDEAALEAMLSAGALSVSGLPEDLLPSLVSAAVMKLAAYEDFVAVSVGRADAAYLDAAQPDGVMMFVRFYHDGLPLLFSCSANDGAVLLTAAVMPVLAGVTDATSLQARLAELGASFVVVTQTPAWIVGDVFTDLTGTTMPQRAVALACEAARRMGDPQYRGPYCMGMPIEETVTRWSTGDYTQPRLMVQPALDVRVHGQAVWGMESALVLADAESPAARQLGRMLYGSWFGGLTQSATDAIAAASTGVGAFYADPAQPDGNGAYILCYEGGHAMLVHWHAQGGVVELVAEYLPVPGLAACQSAADVSMWLTRNASPVVCSGVEID